jgi:hypothetical protein
LNAKSLADLIRIVQGDGPADPETPPTDVAKPEAEVLPLRTPPPREKSSGRA